jgi:hypothetical protein
LEIGQTGRKTIPPFPPNSIIANTSSSPDMMDQVNDYLDDFIAYLQAYKKMLESKKPSGFAVHSTYGDFDKYMKRLDPVSGYLSSKFGKEKAESLVNDFLFCYG